MENETLDNRYNAPMNGGGGALPNATAVLVLGILSIVGCFCYSLPGLIMGVIALALAQKDLRLLAASPGLYSQASTGNLKAGRVCAIIGVCLSALYILIIVGYLIFVGSMVSMSDFMK